MKSVTLIFLIVMSSLYVQAQSNSNNEKNSETENEITTEAIDMKALYNIYLDVMPENDRVQAPERSFKSFYVHSLDTRQVFPNLVDVNRQKLLPITNKIRVKGKMTYVEIFKRTYQYDVENINGEYVHHVKVYFRYAKPADIELFKKLLAEAEQIWNNSRFIFDFGYSFKFDVALDPKDAHFKVNVLNSTRGPYDMNWGRDWDGLTVAHEVGHMMGLGDEYQTLMSESDCLDHSLMCDNYKGKLMLHHYYFILRRLMMK